MNTLLIILFSILYLFGCIGFLQIWLEGFGKFNQFGLLIKLIVALLWPFWCVSFGFAWLMVQIEFFVKDKFYK